MSVAVENGVDASEPRGVFSRAFAKRAQPFEEGEFSCSADRRSTRVNFPGTTWRYYGRQRVPDYPTRQDKHLARKGDGGGREGAFARREVSAGNSRHLSRGLSGAYLESDVDQTLGAKHTPRYVVIVVVRARSRHCRDSINRAPRLLIARECERDC